MQRPGWPYLGDMWVKTLYSVSKYFNWSTSVVSISNPQFSTSGTYTDTSGRDWSMVDIEFTSNGSNFNVGSFAIGYNLMENVSGLDQ